MIVPILMGALGSRVDSYALAMVGALIALMLRTVAMLHVAGTLVRTNALEAHKLLLEVYALAALPRYLLVMPIRYAVILYVMLELEKHRATV